MAERLVRFRQPPFNDLDRQLPAQRTIAGLPSAMDFRLCDLPTIRDILASDFDGATTEVGGGGPLRLLLGTGPMVRAAALSFVLADDGHIDVIGLELDLGWPDAPPHE